MKKIGKIPAGGGWKAHGRAIGKTGAQRRARITYDYVHSAVDDHSRLAYSELLPDEQGPTTAAFLDRALAYFAGHGITVERLMTDKPPVLQALYRRAEGAGSGRSPARVHQAALPWQNGKVERFNRTLQVEWAYRRVFASSTARARAFTRLAGLVTICG